MKKMKNEGAILKKTTSFCSHKDSVLREIEILFWYFLMLQRTARRNHRVHSGLTDKMFAIVS